MKRLTFLLVFIACSVFVYAQQTMVLDDAIHDAVGFFSSRLPAGTTIAITNFEAETKELSDYIIEELQAAFSNTGVRVVERRRLEILQSELNFNMSGLVSDETAQRIGRNTGAQIIISGSIVQFRDMYRIRIQAITVETTEIIGARITNVRYDPALSGLLGRMNPNDAWKHQWLYVGLSAGYPLSISFILDNNYTWAENQFNIPFAFSFWARFQPINFFGIALEFSGDLMDRGLGGFYIVPTLMLRPSSFAIDIFLGLDFIIAENGGLTGGIRIGHKLGPGVIYGEARSSIMFSEYFTIATANFSLGYQIGFIPRRR